MFDNVTNKDDARRQQIITENGGVFGNGIETDRGYDLKYYSGLNVEGLELLLKEGFADPEERQNCAPSIQDIYEFMQQCPGFTAHGYIVTPDRNDYRVSIEGVECGDYSMSDLKLFASLFHDADDFTVEDGYLYCWYD